MSEGHSTENPSDSIKQTIKKHKMPFNNTLRPAT